MKATLESLHATCATCHGRRTFVRACPFCADSGHDHECDDTHVPCVAEVHLLADQLVTDAEDAAKYRAAVEGIQRARNLLLYPTAPWDETVPEVLRVLAPLVSDTPPSGPGGGEKKPETCGMARYVQHDVGPDHRITEPCSHPPKHGGLHSWEPAPRARIAPTPTPEVPPMERVPAVPLTPEAKAKAQEVLGTLRKRTCWLCKGKEDAHCPACGPGSVPITDVLKPTTPSVVWKWEEFGGWMVSPDGGLHCKVWLHGGVDGGWAREVEDYQPAIGKVAIQLARALAEAKRETAHAHGLLDVSARATSQAVRVAAEVGAEGFQVQAAQALLERRDQMAGRTDERGRRRGLEEAASIVRALPLLGKAVRRG